MSKQKALQITRNNNGEMKATKQTKQHNQVTYKPRLNLKPTFSLVIHGGYKLQITSWAIIKAN